jgi:hypothetical protein
MMKLDGLTSAVVDDNEAIAQAAADCQKPLARPVLYLSFGRQP